MGYKGYGLRCGFFLRTASHNPWRIRTAMRACVQSWEWPGHNTRVLQPTGRNSLAVCHQGLSLHVSCPHRSAEPEHPSTATRPKGHLGSLRSHRRRASPLLITGHIPQLSPAAKTGPSPCLPAPGAPRPRQPPTGLPGQSVVPAYLQWLPRA